MSIYAREPLHYTTAASSTLGLAAGEWGMLDSAELYVPLNCRDLCKSWIHATMEWTDGRRRHDVFHHRSMIDRCGRHADDWVAKMKYFCRSTCSSFSGRLYGILTIKHVALSRFLCSCTWSFRTFVSLGLYLFALDRVMLHVILFFFWIRKRTHEASVK